MMRGNSGNGSGKGDTWIWVDLKNVELNAPVVQSQLENTSR